MSKLEPGRKAVVVNGAMSMNLPTNIGKIVTIGNYVGHVTGIINNTKNANKS